MGFTDRENKRKNSIVSNIAGLNEVTRNRPIEDKETKKRISLAILPSMYDKVKKIAYVERKSVSEIVANCLDNYISKNEEKLKEYDEITKK